MTSKLFIHPVTFVNTNDAISSTDPDASVTISGGIAVQKTAYFATKIYTTGVDADNNIISQVSTPIAATDAANKSYVDGIAITTDFSIDNNANVLGVSSGALGTGLTGGSGVVVSLESTQSFTNLTITGTATFSGITVNGIGTPSVSTDAANKSYVDGLVSTAGTGLTKLGNVFSVNASQTQITSVGTLTGLTVSGQITSTVTTGTAPFVIASTTNVPNLNASTLSGATFASPGPIGSTIASTGAFTTLTSTGTVTSSGIVSITNTTESTITTDGALTVAGGVGVAKNLNVGGGIVVSGGLSALGTYIQSWGLNTTDVADSTSTLTGTIKTAGGVGIAKSLNVGNGTYLRSNSKALTDTADLVLGPAPSLGNNDYCSMIRSVSLVASHYGSTLQFYTHPTTTNSGEPTLGMYIDSNQNVHIPNDNKGIFFASGGLYRSTGANLFLQSATSGFSIRNAANTSSLVDYTDSLTTILIPTTITDATESTSTSTGSIVTAGGAGIAKSLVVGNRITMPSVEDAISTSSASLIVTGGVGISKKLYIGDQITSTVTTGTAPFVIASTTNVPNLNASTLSGATFAEPGAIGGTTASSALFTTLGANGIVSITNATGSTSVSSGALVVTGGVGITEKLFVGGQLNSTVSTGTAPFVVASTTNIPNLNASSLNGATFASPGAIGSSTASTGIFTTLSLTGGTLSASSAGATFYGVTIVNSLNFGGQSVDGNIAVLDTCSKISIPSYNFRDISTSSSGTNSTSVLAAVKINTPVATALNTLVTTNTAATIHITGAPVNGTNNTIVDSWGVLIDSGRVKIGDTTESSSISSGALIVAGGVGITKDLSVGGNINLSGTITNTDTTNSTSPTTGALLSAGGLGVVKDVYIGGNTLNVGPGSPIQNSMLSLYGPVNSTLNGPNITATTDTDVYPVFQQLNHAHDNISMNFDCYWNGSIYASSDVGSNFQIVKNTDTLKFNYSNGITAGGDTGVGANVAISISNTGIVSLPGTTASTSTSTGALVVSGGVGISKDVYIGGTTTVGTTVNVTTSSGGALNVAGDLVLLGSKMITLSAGQGGELAPTFTTRSTGTKIVLFPNLSGSSVDYAFGIEANTMWNSVPTSSNSFKWYAGTTNIATLTGTGNMSLRQYTSTVATGTAPFVVSSTTNVPNLNASSLSGATFASPGAIGSTLASTGAFTTLSATGLVSITNTTESTLATNGALIVAGGVGIAKSLVVGNRITMISTEEATSTSSASLIVTGGVGIAKDIVIGQSMTLGGTIKSQGSGTATSKIYTASTLIANTGPGVTVLTFTTGTGVVYYGKVTVLLSENSNSNNTTCFQFEINGRQNEYTVFNIIQNAPLNIYLMTNTVTKGSTGTTHTYTFQPQQQRNYDFSIKVELFGSSSANMTDISIDSTSVATFNY